GEVATGAASLTEALNSHRSRQPLSEAVNSHPSDAVIPDRRSGISVFHKRDVPQARACTPEHPKHRRNEEPAQAKPAKRKPKILSSPHNRPNPHKPLNPNQIKPLPSWRTF